MDREIVDPRFAAGRGEAFSAAVQLKRSIDEAQARADAEDTDFRLPLSHRIEENIELAGTDAASLQVHIPADNVGYRMLQKLGWTPGAGLGPSQHGITEPVKTPSLDNGAMRLGLGREELDRQFYSAENVARRALESEKHAFTEGHAKKRKVEAQRAQRIREDVSTALKTFFCEVCQKQYCAAMEFDAHLSSYAHHHKKRLAEAATEAAERLRKEKGKRGKKAAIKEQVRLEAQVRAAQEAAAVAKGTIKEASTSTGGDAGEARDVLGKEELGEGEGAGWLHSADERSTDVVVDTAAPGEGALKPPPTFDVVSIKPLKPFAARNIVKPAAKGLVSVFGDESSDDGPGG